MSAIAAVAAADEETQSLAFARDLGRYRRQIEDMARQLSDGDRDLREDLAQEGLIALWQLRRERIRRNEPNYVCQSLFRRMLMFLRWSKRFTRQFNPVTERWERGDESPEGPRAAGRVAQALAGAEPEDRDVDEA